MTVAVPANTTAEVWVPTAGRPVTAPPDATLLRTDTFGGNPYAVFRAGPGTYRFATR